MSQNDKQKGSFKNYFKTKLNVGSKSNQKKTKRQTVGFVFTLIGIICFVLTFAFGLVIILINDKKINDIFTILVISFFIATFVFIITGSVISKGKKAFVNSAGTNNIYTKSSQENVVESNFNETKNEEETLMKEKENIELLSQYGRLYEQGLISKEDLERRKKDILK